MQSHSQRSRSGIGCLNKLGKISRGVFFPRPQKRRRHARAAHRAKSHTKKKLIIQHQTSYYLYIPAHISMLSPYAVKTSVFLPVYTDNLCNPWQCPGSAGLPWHGHGTAIALPLRCMALQLPSGVQLQQHCSIHAAIPMAQAV